MAESAFTAFSPLEIKRSRAQRSAGKVLSTIACSTNAHGVVLCDDLCCAGLKYGGAKSDDPALSQSAL